MKAWSKCEFVDFILANGVVGFFDEPVTLKSGRMSHWYVNWRTVAGEVGLIDQLADFLLSFLAHKSIAYDTIYGVPEGATKLALIAQYKAAMSEGIASRALLMGRGVPKKHGAPMDRFFLGEPRGRVVVVEDVTTTGGSLIAAIDALHEAGADVVAAVGLTNRMQRRDDGQRVEDAVAAIGVTYHAMSDARDVLLPALERSRHDGDLARAIEKEFREYGVEPLEVRPKEGT